MHTLRWIIASILAVLLMGLVLFHIYVVMKFFMLHIFKKNDRMHE